MPEGYNHVTYDKRCQIYALKANGLSLRAIGRSVGNNVSTISRELKRNAGGCGYRYKQAESKAVSRRKAASSIPKKLTLSLKKEIAERLAQGWSPDQISGRLKLEGLSISHETIYRMVWADKRGGGSLYKHLRHRGRKYNKRSSKTSGRGLIPGRIDISDRPEIVERKERIGDWEGDTIIGANHKGAIVSLVERHSKYTLLKKVARRTAKDVMLATVEKMKSLRHSVKTITFDNGKEFAWHSTISKYLNATCYFATPYRSWERGLNEHTNGLVRQYLPKKTDFATVTKTIVQKIENSLNHRPRKVLQYKTPYEVFFSQENSRSSVALQS